jgi:hypothetical protein
MKKNQLIVSELYVVKNDSRIHISYGHLRDGAGFLLSLHRLSDKDYKKGYTFESAGLDIFDVPLVYIGLEHVRMGSNGGGAIYEPRRFFAPPSGHRLYIEDNHLKYIEAFT